ncbi:hypothetical protein [Bifidobacterium pullorum]|uniref:hypothetical protein n=1 Tax=Bifidobacterium pullorum TaxID=78448 RepID=UPI003993F206
MTDNQTTPDPIQQNMPSQQYPNTPQNQQYQQASQYDQPAQAYPQSQPQTPQYQYAPSQPAPMPAQQNTVAVRKPLFKDGRMWGGFAFGVLVGIIGVFTAAYISTLGGPTLSDAYAACNGKEGATIQLKDDGTTLTLFQPNYTDDTETLQCVVAETGMPGSTLDKMGQTTAFSGTQEDSWDGFKATWTYNGGDDFGDGLTLIIEEN